jgi:ubiquinone/menaquinone biosynthesis C-methylase UbiE
MSAFWDQDVSAQYQTVETVTRFPAKVLIERSGVFNVDKPVIFDNACGPGIVTQLLKEAPELAGKDVSILAGDINEGMVNACKARGEKLGWKGVEYKVVDAHASLFGSWDEAQLTDRALGHQTPLQPFYTHFGKFNTQSVCCIRW